MTKCTCAVETCPIHKETDGILADVKELLDGIRDTYLNPKADYAYTRLRTTLARIDKDTETTTA